MWPLFLSFRPFNQNILVKSINQRVWSLKAKARPTFINVVIWRRNISMMYIIVAWITYLGFCRSDEDDLTDGNDEESDHLRLLRLPNDEAPVLPPMASNDDIKAFSVEVIAELSIQTASSTTWRKPRFSMAEHSM